MTVVDVTCSFRTTGAVARPGRRGHDPALQTKNAPDRQIRGILVFRGEELLLQGLLNSNSHGNGHADHGVVASVGITGNRLGIVQGAQSKSQKFVKVLRLLPRFSPYITAGKGVLVTKVVPNSP